MTTTATATEWMGRPLNELTREELIKVVEFCGQEIQCLQRERNRWRDAGGDPLKYMMSGNPCLDSCLKAVNAAALRGQP